MSLHCKLWTWNSFNNKINNISSGSIEIINFLNWTYYCNLFCIINWSAIINGYHTSKKLLKLDLNLIRIINCIPCLIAREKFKIANRVKRKTFINLCDLDRAQIKLFGLTTLRKLEWTSNLFCKCVVKRCRTNCCWWLLKAAKVICVSCTVTTHRVGIAISLFTCIFIRSF